LISKVKTTIYKFDSEGNLKRVKVLGLNDAEVKVWKEGNQINFSVSRGGKISHGGFFNENESICVYCHERTGEPLKKLGGLNFHWHCYLKIFNWQRRNVQT